MHDAPHERATRFTRSLARMSDVGLSALPSIFGVRTAIASTRLVALFAQSQDEFWTMASPDPNLRPTLGPHNTTMIQAIRLATSPSGCLPLHPHVWSRHDVACFCAPLHVIHVCLIVFSVVDLGVVRGLQLRVLMLRRRSGDGGHHADGQSELI